MDYILSTQAHREVGLTKSSVHILFKALSEESIFKLPLFPNVLRDFVEVLAEEFADIS